MVAGREVTPKDVQATERLKSYWTIGPGGALVRWGEPGDWQRCVDQVSRFMTPETAKGYCENLHERATGMNTAQHAKMIKAAEGKTIIKGSKGH